MIDEELEKIKKKQLEDMLKLQNESNESKMRTVIDLDETNFDQIISKNEFTLVDFWACLLYTSPSPRDS